MSLRWRLTLLILFATGVPVLTGALVTRQLVRDVLDVGLSPQLDAALEAGVRQARGAYQANRAEIELAAADLARAWREAPSNRPVALAEIVTNRLDPVDLAVLVDPAGVRRTLQTGRIPVDDTQLLLDVPPRVISAGADLGDGWQLELVRPLPDTWRDDAALLAVTLQAERGLRLHKSRLERMYWLPFLGVFLVALVAGLVAATRLGAGITEPISQLLDGTEDVSAGRWDVQLPVTRHDELGRLTGGFNTMVRTLNLQSRRLVDLEKMAGWREMARALAHEVKNPLTPIQLTVEEMRARYPGGDEEYEALLSECTRIVVEEVESLRSVVARFREFSRPVELAPESTDLVQLVRDVAALQRDLRVEVRVARDLEPVPVDPDRLRQILMNLAVNAREATREVDEPRLEVVVETEDQYAVIVFEDNGPGIAVNERERVFEPYRSGKAGGLGLGLALVKGIVLAHGGSIAVDEGDLGGARFTIRLPRRGAPDSGEQDHVG